MKFEFSEIHPPEMPNSFESDRYEKFKRTLVGLLLTQRLDVFDTENAANGRWAPLSRSHAAKRLSKVPKEKRSKPNAVKILQDRGTLRQSFTSASGPGNAHRIEETVGDTVRLATNVEYAAINSEGGTINHPGTQNGFGRGIVIPAHTITIPARPIDEFSTQDLNEINDLTENFVNGKL